MKFTDLLLHNFSAENARTSEYVVTSFLDRLKSINRSTAIYSNKTTLVQFICTQMKLAQKTVRNLLTKHQLLSQ